MKLNLGNLLTDTAASLVSRLGGEAYTVGAISSSKEPTTAAIGRNPSAIELNLIKVELRVQGGSTPQHRGGNGQESATWRARQA